MNWIGDHGASGLELRAPKTRKHLVGIVAAAVAGSKRLRALGAGHSTPSVARPRRLARSRRTAGAACRVVEHGGHVGQALDVLDELGIAENWCRPK